jgi:hypothetical protein
MLFYISRTEVTHGAQSCMSRLTSHSVSNGTLLSLEDWAALVESSLSPSCFLHFGSALSLTRLVTISHACQMC